MSNFRICKVIDLAQYQRLVQGCSSLNPQTYPSHVKNGPPIQIYGQTPNEYPPPTNEAFLGAGNSRDWDMLPSQLICGTNENPIVEKILSNIPEMQKQKAKRLLNLICASKELTWNAKGEIQYAGVTISNSNIVDLISAATATHKIRRMQLVGLKPFVKFLKNVNCPKYFFSTEFLKLMDDKMPCNDWITFEDYLANK